MMEGKRGPVMMPASNYYVLAAAISAALFFVIWGMLHESGDEMPWITAGVSSSLLLCGAVVLREVILRSSRSRYRREQRGVGPTARRLSRPSVGDVSTKKLTIEINAAILSEIRQKSDAAKLLNRFSSSHREVFEMCREYLSLNEIELRAVSPNSPRLAPLLKGRTFAGECHHFHLLKWAEIETRALTAEAQSNAAPVDRVESAEKALQVLDTALGQYPEDKGLSQSREVVKEMIVSIEISGLVEMAERSAYLADHAHALTCYGEALKRLEGDVTYSRSREEAKRRIEEEMEHLRTVQKDTSGLSDIS